MTNDEPLDLDAAAALWQAYLAAHPERMTDAELPPVERFGDSPEMSDELLDLVLNGPKRATAALVAEFDDEGSPLPRIGSHWIACDAAGRPRAIMRSIELRIGPFTSVDAEFAHDEGEGDRTLEWWRSAHSGYWTRACARLGIEWTPDMDIVFERFDVVWRSDAQ
jgi:uncharacterized protein YhfF